MLHTIMMHLVITLSDMKQLKHSQIITKCYTQYDAFNNYVVWYETAKTFTNYHGMLHTIIMHLTITLSDMKQLKHSQIITKCYTQ